MQDSTPGTAGGSGFITSLALDILQHNIALQFPTTGTLAVSSTTASGFTVVQVVGGDQMTTMLFITHTLVIQLALVV